MNTTIPNVDRHLQKMATFMAMASILSKLGTCDRKQVGAIVVRHGRCISWGYNGAPPGAPHCSENNHGWARDEGDRVYGPDHQWHTRSAHQAAEVDLLNQGCRNATHAEANALAFAAREGISTDAATLFVTVSPCDTCSRLLIAAGIKLVYFQEEYRDRRGIELLIAAGIRCLQL